MTLCPKISCHEQNTSAHQLDVNQKEGKHISTFFSVSSFPYISGFQQVQARRYDQDDSGANISTPPSTDKPFPSHTSTSKTRPVFLSQHVYIFDESNGDSTEATLLNKDESDPSLSPTVKSPSNLLATKRAFTRVHFTFPEDSKKLIIEEHKDAKVIPSTHPPQLVAINLLLNPSQLTLLTFVLHLRRPLKTWINLMSVTPPAPTLVTSLHYPNS